jgi:hypothetical protein
MDFDYLVSKYVPKVFSAATHRASMGYPLWAATLILIAQIFTFLSNKPIKICAIFSSLARMLGCFLPISGSMCGIILHLLWSLNGDILIAQIDKHIKDLFIVYFVQNT